MKQNNFLHPHVYLSTGWSVFLTFQAGFISDCIIAPVPDPVR